MTKEETTTQCTVRPLHPHLEDSQSQLYLGNAKTASISPRLLLCPQLDPETKISASTCSPKDATACEPMVVHCICQANDMQVQMRQCRLQEGSPPFARWIICAEFGTPVDPSDQGNCDESDEEWDLGNADVKVEQKCEFQLRTVKEFNEGEIAQYLFSHKRIANKQSKIDGNQY